MTMNKSETSKIILQCEGVVKNYAQGPQLVEVLQNINLNIHAGERVAIVGASGSGKSTLLNVLGGLDKPNAGTVNINGEAFSECNDNERGRIRNQSLGFVYQFHHLLPEFTALENVVMPLLIGGKKKAQAEAAANDLLKKVGLDSRVTHKPSELSGGERQRVAIARALVNTPACVLMDEPTGNLDSKNANAVQDLMHSLSETMATSFVVVTHDEKIAKTMDVVYELTSGELNKIH